MPTMPSSVCTRTIKVSIDSRSAPCEILNGWAKGRRSGIVSISVIFTRSVSYIWMRRTRVPADAASELLLEPRDELLKGRSPLRPFGAARRVSELGIDLEILRVDAGPAEPVHHLGRDRRREELVGPRQHVEHLRAHAREVALGVELHRRLAQGDHRVRVDLPRPALGKLAQARRALPRVGDRAREHLVLS